MENNSTALSSTMTLSTIRNRRVIKVKGKISKRSIDKLIECGFIVMFAN